ncbi:DUF2312 domain-containing protein [Rhizobium leguminosarum]|uniref:DUF2312 domain-containing protein n=1 Tax=Rhizobium leguminosarum TaxID=384 RepID=UPI0015F7A163|nr:DUF2312 domain-containing protein [Rhizobium leguminosarum]MBA9034964.1 uncharacterized protein (UPF0335 family) [Rhizobium leguminosarum]
MTADKQLKSYIDRVLRLKEEQDALGQDIRDVYAEARAEGYDKTVMGKLVAHLRRVLKEGDGAIAEAESIFDTYLHAYQRASGMPVATHTHEEEFDPITGEFVDEPMNATLVATGMQTEIGRKALIAAVDIMIAREDAEEESRANVEEGTADESAAVSDDPASRACEDSERQRASMVGFADDCRTGGKEQLAAAAAPVGDAAAEAHGIPATNSEIDPTEDREEDHSLDGNADASVGGRHVTAQEHRAASAGALVQVAPATKSLRPHCRNPGEHCGGYGSNHCHSCLRVAREPELEACT